MSKEEIALQLTLKVIEQIDIAKSEAETLPWNIYNSIYKNLKTYEDSSTFESSFAISDPNII